MQNKGLTDTGIIAVCATMVALAVILAGTILLLRTPANATTNASLPAPTQSTPTTSVAGIASSPTVAPSLTPTLAPTSTRSPSPTATPRILIKKPSEFIITLADLPEGFTIDEQGEARNDTIAQKQKDPQAALLEYQHQGRVTSYMLTATKQFSLMSIIAGPIAVGHQVIQYKDAVGANRGQEYMYNTMLAEGAQPLSVGELGDRTIAAVRNEKTNDFDMTAFIIITRRYNYVSLVVVTGLKGGVSADDAIKVARSAAKKFD